MQHVNSGCSNRMTGNRDFFVELDPTVTSQIILGDGSKKSAKEKGNIIVHTKEGNKKFITDVLYVLNLSHNLLSVGQLVQKDFSLHFNDGRCKIIDKKNVVIANIEMKNKIFPLNMPLGDNHALKMNDVDLSHI